MSTAKTPSRFRRRRNCIFPSFSSRCPFCCGVLLTRFYSVLLYTIRVFGRFWAMFGLTIGALLAYGLEINRRGDGCHLATLAAFYRFSMAAAMTTQIVLIPPPLIGLTRTAAFLDSRLILSFCPLCSAGI